MRQSAHTLLLAATVAALSSGLAFAESNSTELKPQAYISYSFGAHAKANKLKSKFQDSALSYGFLVSREGASSLAPPLANVAFDRNGLSAAAMNGMPFAHRSVALNEDGSQSAFTVMDWGLLAAGVAGVGYAISQVADQSDTSDAQADINNGGGSSGGSSGGGSTTDPKCSRLVYRLMNPKICKAA